MVWPRSWQPGPDLRAGAASRIPVAGTISWYQKPVASRCQQAHQEAWPASSPLLVALCPMSPDPGLECALAPLPQTHSEPRLGLQSHSQIPPEKPDLQVLVEATRASTPER